MPHSSRRPRASSDRYGRGGGRSTARRAPDAAKHPRAPRPRRAEPHSELDLALDAAAAAPQPSAATFAELGLEDRLVRALAARDIREPFAIQARALPDAPACLRRARPGPDRVGQDAGLRPADAHPPRGQHGPAAREGAPRPDPRPHPRTRPAGRRRARAAGPQHRCQHHHGLRRRVDRQADHRRAPRRHCCGDARPADPPAPAACLHALRHPHHRARRGGSHGRPGLHAGRHPHPRRDARRRAADVLLRHPGPRGRPAGDHLHQGPGAARGDVLDGLRARRAPGAGPVGAGQGAGVAAEIAGRPGRTLFFVRTKHGAERLAKQLSRAGVEAAAIHGDRNQSQRQRALDAFTAGRPRVLVATDVAARGIHVDDVDLVGSSTRRTTTRITCTARAVRPGPGPPAWSSRSSSTAKCVSCSGCTTRRASPRPATRWLPDTTWSGRSPRRVRRSAASPPRIATPAPVPAGAPAAVVAAARQPSPVTGPHATARKLPAGRTGLTDRETPNRAA